MSLSKQAIANLAKAIRDCRVLATAHCPDAGASRYVFFLGALETTVSQFVQEQGGDSTEVSAAFEYEPSDEEVRAYLESRARWQAEHDERKASSTGSAA